MDICSQACTSSGSSIATIDWELSNSAKESESCDYGSQLQAYNELFRTGSSTTVTMNEEEFNANTASSVDLNANANESPTDDRCRVCGDTQAKMHYGVLACFGCKGFFRRALKRANQYECNNNRRCVIDKFERNSCRYCRLQRCLEVGMDPTAVRPDRDFTGPQHAIRLPIVKRSSTRDDSCHDQEVHDETSEWSKRLPVEMRTMLMNLLNIEAKVTKGDTKKKANEVYPLPEHTLRELIEDPSKLKGLRTEMRYEPYRMAANSELLLIAYRRLIAAVDWVTYVSEMIDGLSLDDKIALVRNCFAPLLVFKFAVRTAEVTDDPDVLCLCTFSFVPRNMAKAYTDSYHLSNGLVERALDELVTPLRNLKLKQEEMVCLSATIVLNPHAKDLSSEGSQKIIELRSRIQDTLYHVIKETRSKDRASVQFGNLLLFLSNVTLIANSMLENLQFAQTFSQFGGVPLLTDLFGCFPVEPFSDAPLSAVSSNSTIMMDIDEEDCNLDKPAVKNEATYADVAIQTDPNDFDQEMRQQNRMQSSLLSPLENHEHRDFELLQPPCVYTLTEMFDDANTETRDQFVAQMKDQKALLEGTTTAAYPCYVQNHPSINAERKSTFLQSSPHRCNSFSAANSMQTNERNSPSSSAYKIAIPNWIKNESPSLNFNQSINSNCTQPKFTLDVDSSSSHSNSPPGDRADPMNITISRNFNGAFTSSVPANFMHNVCYL
ncbi:unnamed protein product [Anisakis simplex]|uniref:Nuclear hormone receptor family member nhr-5 (inferred by orthology to a C. elegans protein) n=1 Tax=Anisakis simplex TaxID=6269 RepID=A0A0M3JXE0_ANISI|nr:unnamed protein product [Anisakis simplex]